MAVVMPSRAVVVPSTIDNIHSRFTMQLLRTHRPSVYTEDISEPVLELTLLAEHGNDSAYLLVTRQLAD